MSKSKSTANWMLLAITLGAALSGIYYLINITGGENDMLLASVLAQPITKGKMNADNPGNQTIPAQVTSAVIKTNYGEIEVAFGDKTPNTVSNFEKLAQAGFYNGTKFHRVIQGFMIQAGDPLTKDDSLKDRWGTGGPGYKFDDELSGKEKYPAGTLAMANSGPNTNGSQFFIVTANPEAPLPPSYTVFGHVVSGMDVALKIEKVQTEGKGQVDRPISPVIIESVTLK